MLARSLRRCLAIFAIVLPALPALAQTAIPYVVRDLYALPSVVPGNYQPGTATGYNGLVYFAASSSVSGRELWKSDGTPAGTALVLDINPGTAGSDPTSMTACAGYLYFSADDGLHGRRLWKTDGTPSGTRLARDAATGTLIANPENLVALPDKLLLYANVPGFSSALCLTYDGNNLGSILITGACCLPSGACTNVASITCTGTLGNMWAGAGSTCAAAACNQPLRVACCRPDGTCVYASETDCIAASGTPRAPNTACSNCPDPALFLCCFSNGTCSVGALNACVGGSIVFLNTTCTPSPCPNPQRGCCLPSGQCYMVRTDDDCTSRSGVLRPVGQICASGSLDSNCIVANIACCRLTGLCAVTTPANCVSSRGFIQPLGSSCAAATCLIPNTTNFTPAGGRPVAFGSGATLFAVANGQNELWITDGSTAGTSKLASLPSTIYQPDVTSIAGGRIYFGVSQNSQLATWYSDGTPGGTGPVPSLVNITTGGGVGSGSLFYSTSPDAQNQQQLFATDGSIGSFVQLTSAAIGGGPSNLTAFQNGLMFSLQGTDNRRRWWFTDGSVAGTRLVGPTGSTYLFPNAESRISSGALFYFAAGLGGSTPNLWVTDGTTLGTRQVYPIPAADPPLYPGDPRNWTGLGPSTFSIANGTVFFKASDGAVLPQPEVDILWKTDGTLNGTGVVAHIQGGNDSSLSELAAGSGDVLFFPAQTPSQGVELYKTSGTAGSTQIVKDIYPGLGGGFPTRLTFNNGLLLFNAYVPGAQNGPYLHRSDGNAAGTFMLGSSAPYCCSGSRAAFPAALNGIAVYHDATATGGMELWRSDGTAAGTAPILDIGPGAADGTSGGSRPVIYNGAAYFAALDGLYKTNGSGAGTTRLVSAVSGSPVANILMSTPFGVFFSAADNSLWYTNGTVAGTRRAWPSNGPGYDNLTLTATSSRLFFAGYTSTSGWEVWSTDGSGAAAQLAADLTPGNPAGPNGPHPSGMVAYGSNVYFYMPGPGGVPQNWYVSDGTPANTRVLFTPAEFPHTITGFYAGNNALLISASDTNPARTDLWSYTGSVASLVNLTSSVSTVYPTAGYTDFTIAGPYTYFTRPDLSNQTTGLYRTDGTAAGTQQILPIPSQFLSAGVVNLVPFGSDVVFRTLRIAGSLTAIGAQLYRTHAPASGVDLLAEFPTNGSVNNLVSIGSSVIFSASTPQLNWQQYVTDGTAAGTQLISAINLAAPLSNPSNILKAGPLFYFNSVQGGADLYRTDGSQSGTFRIDNFSTNTGGGGLIAGGVDFGGSLYFRGARSSSGLELWKTDGTPEGTQMVVDAIPGADGSAPSNFALVDNQIFFSGYSFSGTTGQGIEPWVSDGTAAGTHAIANLSAAGDSYPSKFTDLNGVAIFVAENVASGSTSNIGGELFRSDGTAAGTYLLRDILAGANSSDPRELVRLGNYVYFSATDGVHGRELWRTDGTIAGTVLFRDICIGDIGSNPQSLAVAGDRLYFTAYTPETGIELWTSDGTTSGTFLMFEIVTGPSGANIGSLTRAGNRLYFLATVPPMARSLWSFDWAGGLASGFTCAADYNRVAGVTVADIFDYLSDWFAGASRADINGSGTVDVQDIFNFLSVWFAGC